MPRRHAHRRLAALLALVAACPLAACMPPADTVPAARPRIVVEQREIRHEVRFATDSATLDPDERRRLGAFLAALPADRRLALHVLGHADERATDRHNVRLAARRVAAVENGIAAERGTDWVVTGVVLGETAPADLTPGETGWRRNRRVEVIVALPTITVQGCSDWSRTVGDDPDNLPMSGHGCATAVDLAAMVADPADLARGRLLGPADAVHAAEAVVRYRTDKVKDLRHERVSE